METFTHSIASIMNTIQSKGENRKVEEEILFPSRISLNGTLSGNMGWPLQSKLHDIEHDQVANGLMRQIKRNVGSQ